MTTVPNTASAYFSTVGCTRGTRLQNRQHLLSNAKGLERGTKPAVFDARCWSIARNKRADTRNRLPAGGLSLRCEVQQDSSNAGQALHLPSRTHSRTNENGFRRCWCRVGRTPPRTFKQRRWFARTGILEQHDVSSTGIRLRFDASRRTLPYGCVSPPSFLFAADFSCRVRSPWQSVR